MPCYKPLKAWRSRETNPSGKRGVVFNKNAGWADLPLTLPCGQCVGCRLEYSRQWAMRLVHEGQLHERNCFITLTYNDENLPKDGSLVMSDYQDFMKRLRQKYCRHRFKNPATGRLKSIYPKHLRVRFFHCGEYGDQFGRPHYHAILFNHDFGDKKLWKMQNDVPLFRSSELEELWPYGYSSVGALTFQSAAYCARYILKKQTGNNAMKYAVLDHATGEIRARQPDYVTMSRASGLGKGWLDKYQPEVYPLDRVVLNGVEMQPPKFYDRLYEHAYPSDFQRVRAKRLSRARAKEALPERLAVLEAVQLARLERLPRPLA